MYLNLAQESKKIHEPSFGSHGGCCAICLNEIPLQETAMVKGCEHTYWYSSKPVLFHLLYVV